MDLNFLIYDIETTIDTDLIRDEGLISTEALTDYEVEKAFLSYLEDNGKSRFAPSIYHKIVCLSYIRIFEGSLELITLRVDETPEKEIVSHFFNLLGGTLEQDAPTLIDWNGNSFDMQVFVYRGLKLGVSMYNYFDKSGTRKWDNYLNRFHNKHTDLMDTMRNHQYINSFSLSTVSHLLGMGGKSGIGGSQVSSAYYSGNINEICNYCEMDVIELYSIYLRWIMLTSYPEIIKTISDLSKVWDTQLLNYPNPLIKPFITNREIAI